MSYLENFSKIRLAVLALIIANIIWGASFPIYKWSLEELPLFTFAFLRFFLGAIILLPFVYKKLYIAKVDYKNTVFLALFSVTFLVPLLFLGLKLTSSINAPIIFAMGPIILIVASIIFLKEKPKSKVIVGTLISLAGIIAIILRPLLESGEIGSILGNILLFIVTIFSVAQIIILKRLTVRNNPVTIIFWMFLIGSIPLLPFMIWELQNFNIVTDITTKGIVGIFYGVIFSTVIAHYLITYGAKYIHASEIGVFSYIDPLATIAIAIPLLNEKITIAYLVGALLVFTGIYIAEGRIHYHPFRKLFSKSVYPIPPPH